MDTQATLWKEKMNHQQKKTSQSNKKKMCVSSVIKVKARTPALQTAARLLLPVTLQQCNTGQEHNGCAPLSCLSA